MTLERWLGRNTLRRQLTLWLVIPLFVLWVVSARLEYIAAVASANNAFDHALINSTIALVDNIRVDQGRIEVKRTEGVLNTLALDEKDQLFYQVIGPGNELLNGNVDLPRPPVSVGMEPVFYDGEYHGDKIRGLAFYTPLPNQFDGLVFVQVGETTIKRRELVEELLFEVIVPQLLLVLIAAVLVWYGLSRGLASILQVREEISLRPQTDMTPLQEDRVVEELQPLIHGFNELMQRNGNLLRAQQRFIADAAHQLRTPLAGLRAQARLAMQLTKPEDIEHSLHQIHIAAGQAARLAQQLLLLARAEPDAQVQDRMRGLDLNELASRTTANWVQAAGHKKIDLGYETTPGNCLIQGDPMLVGEMLNNLIDNALNYTQSGGQVTVRVKSGEAEVALEVEDNGPGIPPPERERVFERFYRILGTNQEGCGLGLAIVREIAQRHGADVRLLSGPDGRGTLARVSFAGCASPAA
ncbi:MAG TPA: sensor histidine kinase N-terminal domain-containing protein [Gallionella sp.]|nr:sensor histidine kinase N-terminal domain-containing protein [Gallionella sp.]